MANGIGAFFRHLDKKTGMATPLEHYTPDITVHAAGRDWNLTRASNFDELWDGMVSDGRADQDDHIPYWTELWPSSLVLCSFLKERAAEIAGKRCMDIGCGLGLTAIAASSFGAMVTAMDYEFQALRYASLNAERNQVPSPEWVVMDWRHPAVSPGAFHRIWGGDIMYEKRFVAPVLRFFAHALAPDGRVWVAEPGRSVYQAFLAGLRGGGWKGQRVFTSRVDALYAQSVPVTVAVWELKRGTCG